jgi:hypothetical protein
MRKRWKWRWLFRGRVRLWFCAIVLALIGVAVALSWSSAYRFYFRLGYWSGWARLSDGVVLVDWHASDASRGVRGRSGRAERPLGPVVLPRLGWDGQEWWARLPLWCVMALPLGGLVYFWYRDWQAGERGLCVRCRYDLSGLEPEDACPECGLVGRTWEHARAGTAGRAP